MFSINDVYNFLNDNKPFVLCTISSDNKPNARPFGAVWCDNEYLYIATNVNKNVFKEIKHNNNVMLYSLKHGTREWLRVSCEAEVSNDYEKKLGLFESNKILYERYNGIDDPLLRVLKLSVNNTQKQ